MVILSNENVLYNSKFKKCMRLTFELMSVVISDTFWVASPPILMALCVAWEASFDADEENKDHPYNN